MRNEQLIPRRTPESRAATDRVQVVMELTSRLNVLRHGDLEARSALISEILGRAMPETLTIYPPFYCDYGLNLDLEFGERIFVNQNCSFYDLGGITIGDRTMIGPGVTLSTAGHEPNERLDGITTAPIVIESNVWAT